MRDVERDVIRSFQEAERAGRCPRDCYLAAVATWQQHNPDAPSSYARQMAVRIIIDTQRSRFLEMLSRDRLLPATALRVAPRKVRDKPATDRSLTPS